MLPYSTEVLFSLHARYLRELWPFAVPLFILTLSVVLFTSRPRPRGGRAVGVLLATGWLWVGAVFHLQYFATINFAAPLYGGLFILQGLLLAWQGASRHRLALGFRADAVGWSACALVLFAAMGYPLLDYLGGHADGGLRLVGLAPGPTALFTLGCLLLTTGRTPIHLLVLPLIGCLISGFNGWVLAIPADLLLPPLAVVAVSLTVWKNRRTGTV